MKSTTNHPMPIHTSHLGHHTLANCDLARTLRKRALGYPIAILVAAIATLPACSGSAASSVDSARTPTEPTYDAGAIASSGGAGNNRDASAATGGGGNGASGADSGSGNGAGGSGSGGNGAGGAVGSDGGTAAGGNTGGGSGDGGTNGQGVTVDAGQPSNSSDANSDLPADGSCGDPIVNDAPMVRIEVVHDLPALPNGGVIADGIYYETAIRYHDGPGGYASGFSFTERKAIRVHGTRWTISFVDSTPNSGFVSGVVTTSGTNLYETDDCPLPKQTFKPESYTATPTAIRRFESNGTGTFEFVYTRQ